MQQILKEYSETGKEPSVGKNIGGIANLAEAFSFDRQGGP